MKRGGKVLIRLFPDKPITKKPAETRMGKGKGNPEGWVAVEAGPRDVRGRGDRRALGARGARTRCGEAADQVEVRETGGAVVWRGRSPRRSGSSRPTSSSRSRSEEHTSELQSQSNLVCRLLLE